jgi:hypothetical protein
MQRFAILWLALAPAAIAGVLEFEMKAGARRPLTLNSAADDSNFREPRSYASHGAQGRFFIRQIELTNSGGKPLAGRLLVVNGRDWSGMDGLRRDLGLSAESQRRSIERLLMFWRERRSHAGCGLPLAEEPFAALNFWGYTLCGEDTKAFARLALGCDVRARYVQLNGHIAAEYRYDDGWHVVDGDQNAVYLHLDNETLASAEELRADPFLAVRTRVFGRHAPLELPATNFNSSLVERILLADPKPVKVKFAAPLNVFTVQPGESIIWHADKPPEKPVGAVIGAKLQAVAAAALATIEHRVEVSGRPGREKGTISVNSVFPILKAVNHTTGFVFTPKDGEVIFTAPVEVKSASDKISVFAQCSRNALPLPPRGESVLTLDAERGEARVAVHYDAVEKISLPVVKLTALSATFTGTPAFTMAVPNGAERVWWQIATSRDFAFVAPSLDGITPWAPELRLDPITDTFLTPGRAYFLRVKAANADGWGEWSDTVEFRVEKPAQPAEPRWVKLADGRTRLAWRGAPGIEYLVFASNRIDFVPEVFSPDEIVSLDHKTVAARRDNKNLVATTTAPVFDFEPKHHFYRVIARRGGTLSVPGPLVRLPVEVAAGLPPAMALQTRVSKDAGREIYRAREEKLP